MILDFAGDIALSSAESLLLDLKLLQRKGHNLTKLAWSAPQNSKFQALLICKPSHDSSSAHAGRDSIPVKLSSKNHQPKKPQVGISAGPTRLLLLCMESRRQAALWLSVIFIAFTIRSREGVFSSAGWPGKHDWCWKTEGLLLLSQPATSKPFSFSCCYGSTHTHTTAVKVSPALAEVRAAWLTLQLPAANTG